MSEKNCLNRRKLPCKGQFSCLSVRNKAIFGELFFLALVVR